MRLSLPMSVVLTKCMRAVRKAVADLSKQRLDSIKVPEGANRDKELAKFQRQFREVVRKMASGMVAKMDSIRMSFSRTGR